jgi:hypothetical protein
LLGGSAIATWQAAAAAQSTFPIWPTFTFGSITVALLYMCFATIWGWWPAERSASGLSTQATELPAAAQDANASQPLPVADAASPQTPAAGSAADEPASQPSADSGPKPREDSQIDAPALAAVDAVPDEGYVGELTYHLPSEQSEPQPASEEPASTPGPVITDRWHHTSDGFKVPGLMRITHTGLSHPAYSGRQTEDEPPSVKVGMLVACQPINPASSGTDMRAKFAAFLDSPEVRQFTGALTHIEPGMSWNNLAGHGPRTLEAVLRADEDPVREIPIASALFLPPTAGEALYGRDGRAATLILYIEPRAADGRLPPAAGLACWRARFKLALEIPAAFAGFLAEDLGLATCDDPPAQLGIWLESRHQPLTAMVDTHGLRSLPGSWPSNQFMGWGYAAADGGSAFDTARDLMVQLCEYTLHLDDFEQALDGLQPTCTDA